MEEDEPESLLVEMQDTKGVHPRGKQCHITRDNEGNSVYQCTLCPKRYGDKISMEMHLCIHNKEYRNICDICGTGFKRVVHLERHIYEHQEHRPFQCEQCEKAFKRREHLNIHVRKMHLDPNSNKPQLEVKGRQAVITTNADGTVIFCCAECPLKFEDKESIEMHLCMHNKEYRHLCILCGNGLKRKEHLERHMLEHQEVRPHVCNFCGKAFKRKEHLNIHRNIHIEKNKNLVCPICDRSFHRKDHLQKHMQTHAKSLANNSMGLHNDPGFSKIMEAIEERLPVITSISSHQEADSTVKFAESLGLMVKQETVDPDEDPEKPFSCDVCFKRFRRKDNLKQHSMVHDRLQSCSVCGLSFPLEEQLLRHMSQHISGKSLLESEQEQNAAIENLKLPIQIQPLVEEAQRRHECPVCFKRFKRKQHLKVHSSIHARPYAMDVTIWCSLCHQGFQNNEQFENHNCSADGNSENITSSHHNQQHSNPEPPELPMEIHMQELPAEPIQICEDESRVPVPVRVFVCKQCGKSFRRKDHYKIHLNVHTGIKNIFCPKCGKGFYRKDHMQKHLQVHLKIEGRTLPKKAVPDLFPITMTNRRPKVDSVLPEITIHAPSNSKLRVPLQMKVPYQVVTSSENGEQNSIIVHPT